ARRLPSLEPALPRRNGLLRPRPEPRRVGRAGGRRGGARRQLSLLRPPQPYGRAVSDPLQHLPRDLSARVARTGSSGGPAAVPRVPRAGDRAPALVPGAFQSAAARPDPLRPPDDVRLAVRSVGCAATPGDPAVSSAIWITGPPASGKSVLARDTAAALHAS